MKMLTRNIGAIYAKDDGNIFSCKMCQARYCLVCEVPFHEEQTCDQYQEHAKRRSEDEEKSLETVKQVSRPCPGPGCGVKLDKYTGCDHVTCEKTCTISFDMSLSTDCCDRQEVWPRVLLAVLRSSQRSDWHLAGRKLCTQRYLSASHEQATYIQAACWARVRLRNDFR